MFVLVKYGKIRRSFLRVVRKGGSKGVSIFFSFRFMGRMVIRYLAGSGWGFSWERIVVFFCG